MKRVSLSGMERSLAAIWQWYVCQSSLSHSAGTRVRRELLAGRAVSDPVFFGMSLGDVEDFFHELDYLAMFDLLAAAEAALRVNFFHRAYHGRRDPVAREFRALFKRQGVRVRLEDILETWKRHRPAARQVLGQFKLALKLRHWLAHGRYWTPKFRIDYSPADVFDLAANLQKALA